MRKLEEMTDEQLALAYVEGDNRAFDLLLSRNEVKLFGYIMFVVHDQERANDVFQETFVKVITKLQQRQYVPNGKFLAWCMRIAHNVMMDMYRDNRLQNIVETPDDNDMSKIRDEYVVFDNAENTIVRGQVMSDVKKMVNLLPPTQREASTPVLVECVTHSLTYVVWLRSTMYSRILQCFKTVDGGKRVFALEHITATH